ncbi:MAG TPA: ROK family protein [Planctomycetaceae bacterium]|jgi:glucokinase|nr:ROK family protein [Planctomycetaceae bacterium]
MFLGIEIGGTKLQLGVGQGSGPPFDGFRRLDVDARNGAPGIREQIANAGRELFAEFPIQAIGFGFGGPINAAAGIVTKSHQVEGWDNFALAQWCTDQFGVPTYLGNDCDMAALAEARFGAGRHKRSVFYVTVGTGVGGGLVFDGVLFGSQRPAIAEIGHLRPGLDATEPSQTIESRAAGPGIEAVTRTWLTTAPLDDRHATRLLARCERAPQKLTAKMIAEEAAAGNALAQAAMDRACQALGWGIAQVITLVAVEAVIVGGGVSLAGETVFFDPLRRAVATYVFLPLRESYEILAPRLGEEVVVHGAVAMAADRFAAPNA